MAESQNAGGFIPPLSPPASVASQTPKILPEPRHSLLKRGGRKETNLFNYLDTTLDKIEGKVERRSEAMGPGQEAIAWGDGYRNFGELAKDLHTVLDVIWVSATPSIQIPFLLTLAGRLNEYMGRFKFTPKKLFALLSKLDIIFASLISGVDYESKLPLATINSKTMNTTEKVRLRSIVESGRVAATDVFQKARKGEVGEVMGDDTETDAMVTDTETETDNDMGGFFAEMDEDEDWEMDLGRVYEKTIELLGMLDEDPIGMWDDFGARPPASD